MSRGLRTAMTDPRWHRLPPGEKEYPVVLADKDGTLCPWNDEPGGTFKPFPRVEDALQRFGKAGGALHIITNQGWIGAGHLGGGMFLEKMEGLLDYLSDIGIRSGFSVCPHAIYSGCKCQKPSPQMFEKAASEYGQVIGMVGDRIEDAMGALRAGISDIALVRSHFVNMDRVEIDGTVIDVWDDQTDAFSQIIDRL